MALKKGWTGAVIKETYLDRNIPTDGIISNDVYIVTISTISKVTAIMECLRKKIDMCMQGYIQTVIWFWKP